jgi:hypothetical protein
MLYRCLLLSLLAIAHSAELHAQEPAAFTCITPPSDLVSWWSFEVDGSDAVGTSPVSLSGGATFIAGKVASSLRLDGVNDLGRATAAGALNVGTAAGFSIEMWINPDDSSKLMDIVEWNNEIGGIGVHLSTSTASSRDLYANLVDTAGTSHQVYSGPGLLADHAFQHVGLVYDKVAGTAALYWNGSRVALTNLGTFTPQTSYNFFVGTRASGPFQGIWFQGAIDELSVYNRALSTAEIQAIFAAGAAGKCNTPRPLEILTQPQSATVSLNGTATFSVVAQGTAPLRYQWLFNNTPLNGATKSLVTLAGVQPQQAGNYSVAVSDVSGSVTSSVAVLNVLVPLAIIAPPRNAVAVAGTTASFSAVAQSSSALTYQWFFNGSAIAGVTTNTLVLADVRAEQAGRYSVRVANASQSITSAPAALTVLSSSSPVITEFMAENEGSFLDEDSETSDWIEIFNPGPGTVSLQGWYLTDDPDDLTQWRFPATNLAANTYLIVFASGNDRTNAGAPLHTNFRLDADEGYIALVHPDGQTIASEFWPTYPPQRANVSFGWSGGLAYFLKPTPGAVNDVGVLGFVADTKFSTNRGFFFAPIDVTIRCSTPGATIIYTTDGGEPSLSLGTRIAALNATSPPVALVHLTTTTILRAAAFKEDFVPANIDTHTYIFPSQVVTQARPAGASTTWIDDPPGNGQSYPADFTVTASVVNTSPPGYSFTNALLAIPSISLVTPLDGIFGSANGIYARPFMQGTNWERRTSVELIHPDGQSGFQVDAGLRMHGAVSRLNAAISKHPMRLIFRGEYGAAELEYPFFTGSSVQRFDHLVFRACSTDAWAINDILDFLWRSGDATYQRDQWMRDSQLAMGHLSARGVYVHLYLNGLYWGLYNVTERMSDSFFAAHLGGDRTEYDVVTDFDGEAVAGDRLAWAELLRLAGQAPSDPSALWQMQGLNLNGTRNTNFPVLIHLDNFIDYMALHIYAAAIDWPGRNWWAARRRTADSDGFHFFVWDQEIALDRLDRVGTWGNAPANIEAVYEPNTPGQIYDGLRRDPEFKLRFADRLQKHLFNGGALTIQSNRARWAARAAEMDRAIVGESARWGDAHHTPAYTRQADWLRMSNFTQNTYWSANEVRAWQRFRNVGLYPNVGAPVFNQFGGDVPLGFPLVMTHTNATGTIYFTLDGTDPRLRGGALAPSAIAYVQPVVLLSPTLVRARVRSGTSWSAVVEAQFFTPEDFSKLQLSEVMYNPPKFGGVDGEEFEFLELCNTGNSMLDLSGLAFSDGIVFSFPNETLLEPGGFFVLARNAAQFAAKYPGAPLHGLYTGKLDNGGERISLWHPQGGTLFSLVYDNEAPWTTEADNTGQSLQRLNFTLALTNPVAWVAATPTPGGPIPLAFADGDGDGMPDQWEEAHNLDSTTANADGDNDHDGLANLQEFLAGTDPSDGEDRLRLEITGATPNGGNLAVGLRFRAQANKTYTVLWRNAVLTNSWISLQHVGAQPTNRWVTISNSFPLGTPSRFYRLATPKLP